MGEPPFVLETEQDVLDAIEHPELWDSDKWNTKSIWLCNLVSRMKAEEKNRDFVYNADVWHEARKLLGLPFMVEQQNTPLSWMIYSAQRYVRSDKLKADGYELFTPELLERAHQQGHKVLCNGKKCTPKKVGDKWYAFPPRARSRAFGPDNSSAVKVCE